MWDNLNQKRQDIMGSARGQGWLRGAQKTFAGGYGSDLKNSALVGTLGLPGLLGRLYFERSKYNKAKAAYDSGTTYPNEAGYVDPNASVLGETQEATAPTAKETDPLTSEYQNYWSSMKSQFDPLYQKYLSDLEGSYKQNQTDYDRQYGDAKKKLNDDYWSSAESNERNFGQGTRMTQNIYSGKGLGDSTYRNEAMGDVYKGFDEVYSDLNKQKQSGETDLDYQKNQYYTGLNKQYNDSLGYAKTLYNNFYNPSQPQFNSLEDLTAAKGTLDTSLQGLGKGAATQAGKVNPYSFNYKPTSFVEGPQAQGGGQTAGYLPQKSAYGYLKDWLYGAM